MQEAQDGSEHEEADEEEEEDEEEDMDADESSDDSDSELDEKGSIQLSYYYKMIRICLLLYLYFGRF